MPSATTATCGAYRARAGLRVPMAGPRNIALDIGAQYQRTDDATFLRKGDITVDGQGRVAFAPVRSNARMWVFSLGVSMPVGR